MGKSNKKEKNNNVVDNSVKEISKESNANMMTEEEKRKSKDYIIDEPDDTPEVIKQAKNKAIILWCVAAAFMLALLYNVYCSNGHIFGAEVDRIEMIEDGIMVNGKYTRMDVDAVIGWVSGYEVREDGSYGMKGKVSKCAVWLDSNSVICLNIYNDQDFDEVNGLIEATRKMEEEANATLDKKIRFFPAAIRKTA